LLWSQDSERLFYLSARRDGPLDPGSTVKTQYRIFGLSVRDENPTFETAARWEKSCHIPTGYWQMQPQIRSVPESDELYVFDWLDPTAQSLFRIDMPSGSVSEVTAFHTLKQEQARSQKNAFGEAIVGSPVPSPLCSPCFWREAKADRDLPLVFTFGYRARDRANRSEAYYHDYWLLGERGRSHQLLLRSASPAPSIAFIDARTYVTSRRRSGAETHWEIVKRGIEQKQEVVLATVHDVSRDRAVSLIPSRSGRWMIVCAGMSERISQETRHRMWVLAADGSLFRLVSSGPEGRTLWKAEWAHGAEDFYWVAWEGTGASRLQKVSVQADWQKETVVDFGQPPDPGIGYLRFADFIAAETEVMLSCRIVPRRTSRTTSPLYGVFRLDIETKELQQILELDGNTLAWRGLNGWTVEGATYE